jgi:histidinol-phosphate aminotransferase
MSIVKHLARPEILALEPYPYASWEPSLERLHANENPWRADGDRSVAGLNRYPEPEPRAVEARLAALYGVEPRQVLAGRGSDEGIDLLTRALLVPGRDAALTCPPTFAMYGVATRIQGAELLEVPLDRAAGFALDEALLLASVTERVKLVFLCTPNNPTGNALSGASIERIAARLEGRALVVVDEAYAEFARDRQATALTLLPRFPRLVVVRTMSKAFALAGARVGYLAADPAVIAALQIVRLPYHLSALTQAAARAALDRSDELLATVAAICAERDELVPWLRGRGHEVADSDANFVLFGTFSDRHAVWQGLLDRGVLIREVGPPGWLRVSVGTPAENEAFRAAIEAVLP